MFSARRSMVPFAAATVPEGVLSYSGLVDGPGLCDDALPQGGLVPHGEPVVPPTEGLPQAPQAAVLLRKRQ